jgi:acetyltransferase-like isoleucine patch superfamily enzyme
MNYLAVHPNAKIGEGVEIGPFTYIAENVEIGEGTWIGAHATLGRNVTIGKGCMVLADACVMKDMPENTLIGGVPARIVRKLNEVESY